MKNITVTIKEFNFYLKLNDQDVIISINFDLVNKEDLTDISTRQGKSIQYDLFNGKYDWLIKQARTIKLPIFGIEINLKDIEYNGSVRFNNSTITSDLKRKCIGCKDVNCNWDCEESQNWANIKDIWYVERQNKLVENRNFNNLIDAILSLVLAHAEAGIDIESLIYIEGLETAIMRILDK